MHDWQDWESAQIETELLLDKEHREREKSAPATGATATGTSSGCGTILLMLFAGILLLRAITEFFSLFFQG